MGIISQSQIEITYHLFGPSPAIRKLISSYLKHISAIICAIRSTPFLYTSLDTITIVTRIKNVTHQHSVKLKLSNL